MGKKIGIDLGTTYSCVSYVDDFGVVRVIDNQEGEQTTPSVVYFDPDGTVVVGSTAKSEGAMHPECIVERVKNFMGDPDYKCYVNGKEYSAAAVSNLILKKLITDAEAALQDEIEGAVITCPAYFGESARNATKLAGENVVLSNGQNLKVYKILDEPTAAAISYGQSKQEDMDKTILIYDLGGGTFDCTVMKLSFHGDQRTMQVVTTGGNHQLGGKDWDAALTELVRQKFCDATQCDPEEMKADPESVAWFSENIEKAKKMLTNRETTSLTPNFNGQKERVEITRQEFDDVTSDLLEQTIFLVNDMLEKKGLSMQSDIDEIILVGGSTYMPQVSAKLTAEYGKPLSSYEPNKAVAMGAAIVSKDCTEVEAVASGVSPEQVQSGGALTIKNEQSGTSTTIVEICTKSYGLRYYTPEGKPQVLNLILKDTPKPAVGHSGDHFGLTLTAKHELVNQVDVLVLENDSLEEIVELDACNEIYMEEPIMLDGEVYGDISVSVDFNVDANGILTLVLTDANGKVYNLTPRRKSDEANMEGMADVGGMRLR